MTYDGSKLSLVVSNIGGANGPNKWLYLTGDNNATLTGASFFSDGWKRGMRVGDLVECVTTDPKYKLYQVSAVNTTTGAATVAAPTAIT